MSSEAQKMTSLLPGRITSVDFFRGFTMFLLAGEAYGCHCHQYRCLGSYVVYVLLVV
jgi:hypothetical protein